MGTGDPAEGDGEDGDRARESAEEDPIYFEEWGL